MVIKKNQIPKKFKKKIYIYKYITGYQNSNTQNNHGSEIFEKNQISA
jgi:hypothetical protein